MTGLRHLDLCSGVGGFSLAAHAAGFESHDRLLTWLMYRLDRKLTAAADVARSRHAARVASEAFKTAEEAGR